MGSDLNTRTYLKMISGVDKDRNRRLNKRQCSCSKNDALRAVNPLSDFSYGFDDFYGMINLFYVAMSCRNL